MVTSNNTVGMLPLTIGRLEDAYISLTSGNTLGYYNVGGTINPNYLYNGFGGGAIYTQRKLQLSIVQLVLGMKSLISVKV